MSIPILFISNDLLTRFSINFFVISIIAFAIFLFLNLFSKNKYISAALWGSSFSLITSVLILSLIKKDVLIGFSICFFILSVFSFLVFFFINLFSKKRSHYYVFRITSIALLTSILIGIIAYLKGGVGDLEELLNLKGIWMIDGFFIFLMIVTFWVKHRQDLV